MITHRRFTHRALAALAAAGALAALGATAGTADARVIRTKVDRTDPCSRGNVPLSKLTEAQAASATYCLMNKARKANGVPALVFVPSQVYMGRSATQHAQVSVATRTWTDWQHSHMQPGAPGDYGAQITSRIRETGYCPTGSWGTAQVTYNDSNATPAKAVDWWMYDPPHRATLLDGSLKAAGFGVARGLGDPSVPVGPDSAVFVVDFGSCNGSHASR